MSLELMLSKVLFAFGFFFWGELIACLLFSYLNKKNKEAIQEQSKRASTEKEVAVMPIPDSQKGLHINAVIKGIVERFCLFLSLLLGFPQMLIAFGAIKVGTKLTKECQISNDYYLVGNFLSITIVFLEYFLFYFFTKIHPLCPCII